MFKLYHLISVFIVTTLFSSIQPTLAENLLQVYHQAEDNDPILKTAISIHKAAQETHLQAKAMLLPRIEVTAEEDSIFGKGSIEHGVGNGHAYGINMVQTLYNRSYRVRQRLSAAVIEQCDIDLNRTRNELILRVTKAYFRVLAAIDNLIYATAEKNALARQLTQAKHRFEFGSNTINDVYDTQARFDAAVAQEIDSVNKLADSMEILHQLTDQEYVALNPLSEKMPMMLPIEPSSAKEWISMALEKNFSIRSAILRVDQAKENISLQEAAHYPTLDLKISYIDTNNSLRNNLTNSKNPNAYINLQLIFPLYSGGAVSSRLREAAHNHEASRQNLEQQQRETVLAIRNAYRGQKTAISQIKALDQFRISSRCALESNRTGYSAGTRTILDVLDAERNVYLAERNYAAARYAYIDNYLTLRHAAGQLSEKEVVTINSWLDTRRSISLRESTISE
jgi:outer membrane protein